MQHIDLLKKMKISADYIEKIENEIEQYSEENLLFKILSENEKKFKEVFNYSKHPIFLSELGKNGIPVKFIEVNNLACEILGYSRSEMLKKLPKDVTCEECFKDIYKMAEEILIEGNSTKEMIFITKDNIKIPVKLSTHIFEMYGKKYASSIAINIWDKKNMQKELKLHKTYFKQLFENSPEAIAILDNNLKIISVNKSFEILFQYMIKDIKGNDIREIVCTYKDECRECMFWNITQNGQFQKRENLKKRCKNGNLIDVDVISYPIINNYKQVGIYVIYRDITESKKSEDKLKLFFKLLENNTEGVVITDNNGKIVWINHAFTKISGYEDDVIGCSYKLLAKSEENISKYKNIKQYLSQAGNWRGEICGVRKNGEEYPQRINIFAIKDDKGNITNLAGVFSDITEEKYKEEKINRLAFRDSLTDLYNGAFFVDKLNSELLKAYREEKKLAVLFMDLDKFKRINDNLGHTVGDRLLQMLAERLKRCITQNDIIARLGGDEFVILLPQINSEEYAFSVAKRITESFEKPFMLEKKEIYMSNSIGVAIYPDDGLDSEALMRNADIAMYKAKEKSGNNVQLYTPKLNEEIKEQFIIENNLRYGLDNDEFILFYQPIVDVNTEQIVGAEALIRWNNKELGFVPPNKFIPVSENTGVIFSIGEWVLRTACKQNKKWQEAGYEPIFMSVNISVRQLERKGFANLVESILNETGLDPQYLELEITETVYMENLSNIITELKALSQLGVKLSIDDFGTGYSSLSQLNKLDIEKLKIDRSFINDINENENNTKIVSAIISMAKSLNLDIVAEGVETQKQLRFLKESNCNMIQGYLFSKPVDCESFEKLFDSLNKI